MNANAEHIAAILKMFNEFQSTKDTRLTVCIEGMNVPDMRPLFKKVGAYVYRMCEAAPDADRARILEMVADALIAAKVPFSFLPNHSTFPRSRVVEILNGWVSAAASRARNRRRGVRVQLSITNSAVAERITMPISELRIGRALREQLEREFDAKFESFAKAKDLADGIKLIEASERTAEGFGAR